MNKIINVFIAGDSWMNIKLLVTQDGFSQNKFRLLK